MNNMFLNTAHLNLDVKFHDSGQASAKKINFFSKLIRTKPKTVNHQ